MVGRKMAVVDPEKIKWEPVEEYQGRAWRKVLSRDQETGAMATLFKVDKGFHSPKHKDPYGVHIMVLEGGGVVDEKGTEVKKGMYWFIPAGVEHGPIDMPEGCLAFIYFTGPPD